MTVTQPAFVAALMDPARPVPDGIVDPDGAPTPKRFAVYRNNVAVSLSDALEAAFPVVRRMIGPTNFRNIAGVFLRQHPPETPLMMFYGAAFPGFLAAFPPLAKYPYLPDMARLELALRSAYHAADAAPLPPDTLAAIPPEALAETRLALAPATQVLISDWPLHGLYRFNTEEGLPRPPMAPECALITRPDLDPMIDPIPAPAARLTAALLRGETLGQAAEAAGDGLDLGAILGLLLSRNALTGKTLP